MEIVKTIEGKKRGFKFTMLTFQYFSDHTGVEFGEIMDYMRTKSFGSLVIMLLAANTVYEKGVNGEVSKFDVDDWIAKMTQEDLQDIWDCYQTSAQDIISRLPKPKEAKKK